jgi:hypothetical protein
MIVQSKEQTDFIDLVSQKLAESFVKKLIQLGSQRKYENYAGSLEEILKWTWEFFDLYYDKFQNWKAFQHTEENNFNAESPHEFIIAFGHARFIRFCVESAEKSTDANTR